MEQSVESIIGAQRRRIGIVMNQILDAYLDKIDQYLKPMPASERIDIVKEIKSELSELELQGNLTPEEILERMGDPKELAKAYLGSHLTKSGGFQLKKLGALIAFYGLTGISGMFILPMVSILSIGLMAGAVIAPIGGLVKFIGYLFGQDVPFVMFQIGSYTAAPPAAFALSIVFGLLFFLAGRGLWKLLLSYIKTVSRIRRNCSRESS